MNSPATEVRRSLTESRAAGLGWDAAWHRALESFEPPASARERRTWVTVLNSMEDHWRDAYVGAPPPKCVTAFMHLRNRAA